MAADDASEEAGPTDASAAADSDDDENVSGEPETREEVEEEEDEYDSDTDSDYDSEEEDADEAAGDASAGGGAGLSVEEYEPDTPADNFRRFIGALNSRANIRSRKTEEEDEDYHEKRFDFPKDPENWREEDLRELWADRPIGYYKPGWDPVTATQEDLEFLQSQIKEGKRPVIAPFYVPYRKPLPAIPDNHHDISNPKAVIEELDRIEEFLKWVSYIFEDGSSYEGTVWDDRAHGKGVYIAEQRLLRYEGEWLQNEMEGHGVLELDIPDIEPVPGSKLEAEMRAKGKIISRDFMSEEDRKWLEMDIEDTVSLAGDATEIPFYERDEWLKFFGRKPEKGRYRYAGEWKHGRMHGCGVYEVNERIIYGRFYFGEHLEDTEGCDMEISTMHAGIAEVAAAKARMFMNKPDGMVREQFGPYGDPQHPYFYEEEDVWMAPGFINQFYEVPDYWKVYAEELDKEREMWLNSFYRSPLRIPMPAELEYWWSKDSGDDNPEFILVNKEPEPDPEDPTKLVYTEDPLIYHTRTGRFIDYVEDEEHGLRLFWLPESDDDKEIDLDKVEFLPLGYDEFFGQVQEVERPGILMQMVAKVQNTIKPLSNKLRQWAEEKKKATEMNLKLIEEELELVEAEICLEEALEDLDEALKMKQKEEERKAAASKDENVPPAGATGAGGGQDEAGSDGDDDEDDSGATSFGAVGEMEDNGDATGDSFGETTMRRSPFSAMTLSVSSFSIIPIVPPKLRQSLQTWGSRMRSSFAKNLVQQDCECNSSTSGGPRSVNLPRTLGCKARMRTGSAVQRRSKRQNVHSLLGSVSWSCPPFPTPKKAPLLRAREELNCFQEFSVLSFHVPLADSWTPSF